MAHLKIFYAAFFAHFNPFIQLIKGKRILVFTRHLNVNKLNGGSFAADLRIQRRRKKRRKNAVHSILCGAAQKLFRALPICRRKRFKAVIAHQAVRMEPVRVDQLLARQNGAYNLNFDSLAFFITGKPRLKAARRQIAGKLHPNAAHAAALRRKRAVLQREQKIRKFVPAAADIIIVRFIRAGHFCRYGFRKAEAHIFLKR